MAVGQHLDLDVARPLHVLLQVDLGGAEGRGGLALSRPHGGAEALRLPDDPHPAPAPSQGRLEEDRIAELLGRGSGIGLVAQGAVAPGQERDVRLPRQLARSHLVAEEPDHLGARADEPDG